MSVTIRSFTPAGVEAFRDELRKMRSGKTNSLPEGLVDDDELAPVLSGAGDLDPGRITTKFQTGVYFGQLARSLPIPDAWSNAGLWTWFAAACFDQISRPKKDGSRSVRSDEKYILVPEWRKSYRHLLAGPARLYDYHRDSAKLMLHGNPWSHGDWIEQLASRQEIATNRTVIEVANTLYWNADKSKPKVGAAVNRRDPGTLRRFIDVIDQYYLTYDLPSMEHDQLLSQLPPEFEPFRP